MGEGFPLWSLAPMVWEGREPLRDWICLSVSLCFCVLAAALSSFRIYMEIRNSDWTEAFAVIFLPEISFLAPEEGHLPPYGWPTRVRDAPRGAGRTPCPVATSGTVSRGFFLRNSPNIPKLFSVRFYPVWILFDMGFLRNIKHATNRNWHWALDQYVSPKNSIKSCQKYMEVV